MAIQEPTTQSVLPQGDALQKNIRRRKLTGRAWQYFFFMAVVIAFICLLLLGYNIMRSAFGVVAEQFRNDPDELAEQYITLPREFDSLTEAEEMQVATVFFQDNPEWLRILTAEYTLSIERTDTERLQEIITIPFGELANEDDIEPFEYPAELEATPFGVLGQLPTVEQYIEIIYSKLGQ